MLGDSNHLIVICACGTMAAAEFHELCNYFAEWADVRAAVTNAALRFTDRNKFPKEVMLFTDENEWSDTHKLGDLLLHVELQKWAEVIVIAPISGNTLAKIASGICDNLVTCIARSWDSRKPFLIAPDMNPMMWDNPMTEYHLTQLEDMGIRMIRPVTGRSDDGDTGTGGMQSPSQIVSHVKSALMQQQAQPSSSSR